MPEPSTLPPVQPAAYRIAHVSDPHLSTLAGAHWPDFLNKRVLGWLSWRIRRRREHRPEILDRLVEDLAAAGAEHVLVTGDLTHVGLPSECREAADWLRRIGSPDSVSLVPGNHDRYVAARWSDTAGLWQPYMQGDAADGDEAGFPYLRQRGPIAVIGLSTAVPTPPFFATGTLGEAQLERLARLLDVARTRSLFRVVLIHHPPVDAVSAFRRRLTDAAAFRAVLESKGAELVLHGHAHRWVRTTIGTGSVRIPVFGIPSASALTSHAARRAGYSLFDVARHDGRWDVTMTERRLADDSRTFMTSAQDSFALPAVGG